MQFSIKFNILFFRFYHCIPKYSIEIYDKLYCHIPVRKLPPSEARTHIIFHQKEHPSALSSELSDIHVKSSLKQVILTARFNYKLFQVNFVSNFLLLLYTNLCKFYVDTLQIYISIHGHIFNKYH